MATARVKDLMGGATRLSVLVRESIVVDFLVSLVAYGEPGSRQTLDAGPEWFDEVERRASAGLLRWLEEAGPHGGAPWGNLIGLALQAPPAGDVAAFIDRVERCPARDLWLTLAGYRIPVLQGAAGGETYLRASEGDAEAREELRRVLRQHDDEEAMSTLLDASPERAKRLCLEIFRGWYAEVYSSTEGQTGPILARDALAKQALALSATPEVLFETATNGVEMTREPWVRRVILVPHVSMRPWNVLCAYEDTAIICYPAADESMGFDRSAPPARLLRLHKALGDEKRLRMLKILVGGPASLQELADAVGLAKSSAHHHLVILRSAGLVRVGTDKDARYRLRRDYVPEAAAMLPAFLEGGSQ